MYKYVVVVVVVVVKYLIYIEILFFIYIFTRPNLPRWNTWNISSVFFENTLFL
jgi:hypothetical protein